VLNEFLQINDDTANQSVINFSSKNGPVYKISTELNINKVIFWHLQYLSKGEGESVLILSENYHL
jgi:hypothetical protein